MVNDINPITVKLSDSATAGGVTYNPTEATCSYNEDSQTYTLFFKTKDDKGNEQYTGAKLEYKEQYTKDEKGIHAYSTAKDDGSISTYLYNLYDAKFTASDKQDRIIACNCLGCEIDTADNARDEIEIKGDSKYNIIDYDKHDIKLVKGEDIRPNFWQSIYLYIFGKDTYIQE